MATWADNLQAFDGNFVFAYDFEQITGPVLDSANSNDATNNGATRGITGKIGNAFSYDGVSDSVSVPIVPAIGTNEFTIAGWWYFDNFEFRTCLFELGDEPANTGILLQYNDSDGSVESWFNGSKVLDSGNLSLVTGTWYNFVLRRLSGTAELFFNAVSQDSVADATNITIQSPYTIAAANHGTDKELPGRVDLFYQWNTGLSNAAVTDFYNAGAGLAFPGPGSFDLVEIYDNVKVADYTEVYENIKGGEFTEIYDNVKQGELTEIYDNQKEFDYTEIYDNLNSFEFSERYVNVGAKRYDFYLYDSTGALLDTNIGVPYSGTTYTDLFPGTPLTAGIYRIDVEANEFLPAKEKTPDTQITFEVDGGGNLILPAPNAPTDLESTALPASEALVAWKYSTTNQAVAPAVFNVYHNNGGGPIDYGTVVATVAYVEGQFEYNRTLTLIDGFTYDIGVRSESAAAVEETNTDFTTVTIDGTPPEAIPFTFEIT